VVYKKELNHNENEPQLLSLERKEEEYRRRQRHYFQVCYRKLTALLQTYSCIMRGMESRSLLSEKSALTGKHL